MVSRLSVHPGGWSPSLSASPWNCRQHCIPSSPIRLYIAQYRKTCFIRGWDKGSHALNAPNAVTILTLQTPQYGGGVDLKDFWCLVSLESKDTKCDVTRWGFCGAKCSKIRFWPGLRPGPSWKSSRRSPNLLVALRGPIHVKKRAEEKRRQAGMDDTKGEDEKNSVKL